jgi:CDP-diacylglycerol--glycerol-3-phosphate 3-phosphatidyltransferase
MTPANVLTGTRLVAAPVFAVLINDYGPVSWWLWALWAVLATSDGFDGHIARRQGATSSGAFLDPLADKVLVLCALGMLASLGVFSWIPWILIAAREVSMQLFRVYASKHKVSVPASRLAKWKTFVQDVAIGFVFFPPVGAHHLVVARILLWVAVGLTLVSGLQYVFAARRLMQAGALATPASDPEVLDAR